MIRWHKNKADQKFAPDLLPDGLYFHDLDAAWEIWRLLEWIEWRWPPNVILEQPAELMADIAQLHWYSRVVKESMVGPVGTFGAPVSNKH